jgi:hypothetical protein
MNDPYQRSQIATWTKRLNEQRRWMQVLIGPRQAGKTTLIHQALRNLSIPHLYVSADEPTIRPPGWIASQWESTRLLLGSGPTGSTAVLVIDEVQKLPNWSETVMADLDRIGRGSLADSAANDRCPPGGGGLGAVECPHA